MKKIIAFLLALVLSLSFVACDEDDNATTTPDTQATPADDSAKAPATNTTEDSETETTESTTVPTEDSEATEPTDETTPTEDTTKVPVSTAPTEDATKAPSTAKPAEDTTKAPTTSAPAEDTTEAHTTSAPAEDTTMSPTTTAPAEDTGWGKNEFEKMLPVPPPFADEIGWSGKQISDNEYRLTTNDYIWETDIEYKACVTTMEEYANSFKQYGYDVQRETINGFVNFRIFDISGKVFVVIRCSPVVRITITAS